MLDPCHIFAGVGGCVTSLDAHESKPVCEVTLLSVSGTILQSRSHLISVINHLGSNCTCLLIIYAARGQRRFAMLISSVHSLMLQHY